MIRVMVNWIQHILNILKKMLSSLLKEHGNALVGPHARFTQFTCAGSDWQIITALTKKRPFAVTTYDNKNLTNDLNSNEKETMYKNNTNE